MAAPLPAPIQDSRLAGSSTAQVALYLGYADSGQMSAAHEGLLVPENLGSSDLQPAAPGVFLVGTAREWSCEQQECSFQLDMAGTDYTVTYQAPGEKGVDLNGGLYAFMDRSKGVSPPSRLSLLNEAATGGLGGSQPGHWFIRQVL